MIFRNMAEARKHEVFRHRVSWRTVWTETKRAPDGSHYIYVRVFDHTKHECKRCRNALGRGNRKRHGVARAISSPIRFCPCCGNPYYTGHFEVERDTGTYFTMGRIH